MLVPHSQRFILNQVPTNPVMMWGPAGAKPADMPVAEALSCGEPLDIPKYRLRVALCCFALEQPEWAANNKRQKDKQQQAEEKQDEDDESKVSLSLFLSLSFSLS
jgi:hypothetical protein